MHFLALQVELKKLKEELNKGNKYYIQHLISTEFTLFYSTNNYSIGSNNLTEIMPDDRLTGK